MSTVKKRVKVCIGLLAAFGLLMVLVQTAWAITGGYGYYPDTYGKHSTGEVYSMRVDGCDLRKITDSPKLAFVNDNPPIPANFGRAGHLRPKVMTPSWSPDGSRLAIAILSYEIHPWKSYAMQWQLYTMNADGSDLRRITNTFGRKVYSTSDFSPTWSPDGTRIAFVRWENPALATDKYGGARIWVANADGTGARRLINDSYEAGLHLGIRGGLDDQLAPAWSPSGDTIAFSARGTTEQDLDIFSVKLDGSTDLRRLTDDSAVFDDDTSPQWSPDGTELAYLDRSALGSGEAQADLKILNLADSTTRKVTTISPEVMLIRPFSSLSQFSWSPDGTNFVINEHSNIVTIDTDGTARHILLKGSDPLDRGPSGEYDIRHTLSAPSWSPDGSHIVFIGRLPVERTGSSGGPTIDIKGVRDGYSYSRRKLRRVPIKVRSPRGIRKLRFDLRKMPPPGKTLACSQLLPKPERKWRLHRPSKQPETVRDQRLSKDFRLDNLKPGNFLLTVTATDGKQGDSQKTVQFTVAGKKRG